MGHVLRIRKDMHIAFRIIKVNIRARMENPGDFLLGILLGIVWQASVLVFATVLLTRFPGLGGWTKGQVLLIASTRLLSHGFYVSIFMNVFMLPRIVQEGRIDGYLLRPMPVYRQVLLSRFNMNAIGDLFVACVLFALSLSSTGVHWTFVHISYITLAIISGTFMEAAIQTVVCSFALRTNMMAPWASWIDDLMATFGNYPLRILPAPARIALTFVLPVAFVSYLPAAAVTGHVDGTGLPAWIVVGSPLVGLSAFAVSQWVWRCNLRAYGGVGG